MSPSVRRGGRRRVTRTTRTAGTATTAGSPAEGHVGYTWNNIYEHKTVSHPANGVLSVRCASYYVAAGEEGGHTGRPNPGQTGDM